MLVDLGDTHTPPTSAHTSQSRPNGPPSGEGTSGDCSKSLPFPTLLGSGRTQHTFLWHMLEAGLATADTPVLAQHLHGLFCQRPSYPSVHVGNRDLSFRCFPPMGHRQVRGQPPGEWEAHFPCCHATRLPRRAPLPRHLSPLSTATQDKGLGTFTRPTTPTEMTVVRSLLKRSLSLL